MMDNHIPEHTCYRTEVVQVKDGWFVDAITESGRRFRYTVLGRTPYAISDESEARDFAAECVGEIFDEISFVEM